MPRFLADENFNNNVLQMLRGQYPHVDVLRIQDANLRGEADPEILEFAAREERLLLTHDIKTMIPFAHDRIAAGLRMPGLCLVDCHANATAVAEAIAILEACSYDGEWEGCFAYLPLRVSAKK